jgi:phosphatidylglycerol:prolipoprotein diacylglycerol transferase
VLPYFEIPSLNLPLGQKLDIFGVVSAAGCILGAYLAARAARWYGPGDDGPLRDVVPWAVIIGLTGGHWMHLFAYHPELLRKEDPWYFLRMWEGLSSMGGVLGALLGIWIFFKKEKLDLYPYWDALALGTAPGWTLARIGCFLVHDHPGVRTDFFLAVNFPGGARHDLGLYDAFVLGVLSIVLYRLARKRRGVGMLMGVLALCYSVCRFFLDFLRASDMHFVDKRYFGLTPAQYTVLVLGAVGLRMILTAKKRGLAQVVAPVASELGKDVQPSA